MSLTLIAIAGVLLGFLCLLVGFFMDTKDVDAARETRGGAEKNVIRERRMKTIKRRAMGSKRRAA